MQAASAQASVPAIHAVAGLSAGAESSKRISAQNVGVKSSSYLGSAFATGKPKRSSSKSVMVSPARASLIGKMKDAVADKKPSKGSSNQGTVQIKGQLVLSKQSFLDLVKIGPGLSPIHMAQVFRFPAALLDDQLDAIFNQLVALQLVSVDTKPDGQPKLSEKTTIEKWTTSSGLKGKLIAGDDSYAVNFKVPSDFGKIGAFIIRNNHPNPFYLHDLTIETDTGVVYEFPCNSWVYNDRIYHDDRVFFSNKSYLPNQTPAGLKPFREREIVALRGDGTGKWGGSSGGSRGESKGSKSARALESGSRYLVSSLAISVACYRISSTERRLSRLEKTDSFLASHSPRVRSTNGMYLAGESPAKAKSIAEMNDCAAGMLQESPSEMNR
ncbi:hypothetical protein R1sor_026534 [Riccia sorocarpa]|uniref:Lipoxygenase n=1 Tax=Riccia sorocarpa TaxID=122646 RepID=A0ABD3GFB2_9MARC